MGDVPTAIAGPSRREVFPSTAVFDTWHRTAGELYRSCRPVPEAAVQLVWYPADHFDLVHHRRAEHDRGEPRRLIGHAGNATIGIRGGPGIFTTKEAININGTLTPHNCPPAKRPGYKIPLWCGPIQQATAGELSHYVSLFTSKPGQNGGVPGLTNAKLNTLGITPGWHPSIGTTLPNNVLIQAVQHGTQPGQLPPPTLPPPSAGPGARLK